MDKRRLSILNWRMVIKQEVTSTLSRLLKQQPGKFYIEEYDGYKGFPCIAIRRLSGFTYSKATGIDMMGEPEFGKVETEKPAALIYSFNVNGAVTVILYPHESGICKIEPGHFIIDLLSDANALGGISGVKLVKKHFQLFIELSDHTRVARQPDGKSGKLIAKLRKLTKKYKSIFADQDEAEKIRYEADLSIAGALIVALLVSVAIPIALRKGEAAADTAMPYNFDWFVSLLLSEGSILFTSFLLIVFVIFRLRTYK